MKDKEKVVEFTRGVMDSIRDFIKDNYPETHKEMDTEEEITTRILKNGERGYYIRKRKKLRS